MQKKFDEEGESSNGRGSSFVSGGGLDHGSSTPYSHVRFPQALLTIKERLECNLRHVGCELCRSGHEQVVL